MISLATLARSLLTERMSFHQLFNSSTPSRKNRAKNMKVQTLPVMSNRDEKYWNFSFRSAPDNNTTGKSWKGRITFPKSKEVTRPDRLMCEVDCGCPDYKFRWAYANNKSGAGPLGFNSLNKSNGMPADMLNPENRPGLCKHLLALKDGLRKKLSASRQPTLSGKLDEVVDQNPQFDITYEE